ncbi:MAG: hypothetical protein IT269_07320 [Saprospiraceae bacterium]|nr:hypothetical protein [Saprospiraceae bacterium]
MKNVLSQTFLLFFWGIILFSSSCDNKETLTEEEKLPPVTESGSNTFGCLINDRAYIKCQDWADWDIKGGNYPLSVQTGLPLLYSFSIRTYDKCSEDDSWQSEDLDLEFGVDTNMKTYKNRASYENHGTASIAKLCKDNPDFYYHDSLSASNWIKISKMDRTNRILSGTFEFDLYTPGCTDTVKIRKGRFDVKF